ncbi:AAE14 [Scenedesmus sp. PABB004]|nr:AAE14 [Scenedesmus sp. PABB004]
MCAAAPHLAAPLLALAQAHGRRPTFLCEGRVLSGAQVHDAVALLSGGLSAALGLAPGDRVALLGHNSDAWLVALLAALDAGGLACPLNWRWSAAELAAALELTQPAVLLVDDACAPLAAAAAARLRAPPRQLRLLPPGDAAAARQSPAPGGAARPADTRALAAAGAAALGAGARPALQLRQPGPLSEAPGGAVVCFTSGTTGASKGAVLGHGALLHQGMAKLAVVGYCAAEVYLHVPPLCHVGGLSSALALLLAGGAHVFLPRYTPAAALSLIMRHHVSALIVVPTMVADLAAAAAAGERRGAPGAPPGPPPALPSLRRVLVGGGGLGAALARGAAALFPAAELLTAYGMTECSSSLTFIPLAEQQAAGAARGSGAGGGAGVCVGWPAPGVCVRVDPAPGHAPARGGGGGGDGGGGVGEVVSAGPHVMQGYWRDAPASAAARTRDGWLRTGDLGYLDARGALWLLGRAKDTIRSGGENVHASEVEAALLSHPGVRAAAAAGLPHARLGELVAAGVVLAPGWTWADGGGSGGGGRRVGAAELQAHCRALGLSPFKLPRLLAALPALPLNSSGKVVKPALQDALAAEQRRQEAAGGAGEARSRL